MVTFNELHKLTSNLNILYAEDNKEFAEDTCELFENFFCRVDLAKDGQDAYSKYLNFYEKEKKNYDIVITDIQMPNMSGLDLTKNIYLHNEKQIIIVISAHNDSEVLLTFLNIGIEYFIVKPFDLDEIMKILYKTSLKIDQTNKKVELINNYTWDKKTNQLFHHNKIINLTKKEILLLEIIINNGNIISKKDDLLNDIWVNNIDVSVNSLSPIISRLRKKLPEKLIKSIYGIGYKIEQKDK